MGSSRYSATACQVVTQSRPTLVAVMTCIRQSRLRKLVLSPLRAAASLSEISRSSNGPYSSALLPIPTIPGESVSIWPMIVVLTC